MIVVANYGLGNISSVINMIHRIGGRAEQATSPQGISTAGKVILPGVGAFDHGMESLRRGGWIDALNEAALGRRIPVLGICLGMQLMCRSSQEGRLPGLGWIDAEVVKFSHPPDSPLKIPHMGWNAVSVVKPNPLLAQEEGEQRFYFVHSYHAVCARPSDVMATVHHGYDVTAAFSHGNIFGAQFHPEKSHRFGMALMKRFADL